MGSFQSPRVFLLSDPSRGFGRGVLQGILRYSSLHGRWRFYHRQPSYLSSGRFAPLDEFRRWAPDGVVCSVEQSKSMAAPGVPMLGYDPACSCGPLPCIITDDGAVGQPAAVHLIEMGQKIIARAAGVLTRQSTSVLMVKNQSLRRAVRFIRENVAKPVRVSELVQVAGL